MWIVKLALRRPYTFVVMAILMLVMGAAAIVSMPTDIFPHIDIPVVSVVWAYQGMSPEEMAERMAALAKDSVDRLVVMGNACDFYNDIAIYYPLRVLMTILGLPRSDEERLLKITQAYFGGGDPEMP